MKAHCFAWQMFKGVSKTPRDFSKHNAGAQKEAFELVIWYKERIKELEAVRRYNQGSLESIWKQGVIINKSY